MAKNAYFGTDTGNFGTGTAMYGQEEQTRQLLNNQQSTFTDISRLTVVTVQERSQDPPRAHNFSTTTFTIVVLFVILSQHSQGILQADNRQNCRLYHRAKDTFKCLICDKILIYNWLMSSQVKHSFLFLGDFFLIFSESPKSKI